MLAMKLLTAAAGISSAMSHIIVDTPSDARCGAPELVLNGVVEFVIIPFNYCLNQADMALNNFQKMKKTQKVVKDVMASAHENFGWDIRARWALPEADTTCTLPAHFIDVFETDEFSDVGRDKTFTVVFNLVLWKEYEDADVSILNTQVNEELVNKDASSTYTICGLSQEECDKIDVFEAWGRGSSFFGMFVLDGQDGPNSFELIPTDTSIISTLGCNPNYVNAIPYESLNDSTGDITCECICPFGFKWEKLAMENQYECVAIDQPLVLHPCSSSQHDACYSFTTSGHLDTSATTCSLNNYLKSSELPVPFDNYVWATANEENGDAMVKFEFIDASGQSKLFEETWWDVHTDWEAILDKVGLFESVGHYQLIITAHDYEQSETCTTDMFITDSIATVTTEDCPDPVTESEFSGNPPAWNEYNIEAILQVFKDYLKNIQSRDEDPCTDGDVCDAIHPYFKDWEESSYSTTSELLDWDIAFKLNSANKKTLEAIHVNICSEDPGSPKTKCWRVARHYGRESELFTCSNVDEPESNQKECLFGEECKFTQCATYTGTTFFETSSTITQDIQDRTLEVAEKLGLTDFANQDKVIIEFVNADVLGEGTDGVKLLDLSNVLVIDRKLTPFSSHKFVGFNDISPEDAVACRYQLDGGEWKEYRFGKTNEVTFSAAETKVNLQCLSSIGPIHEEEYTVLLFPHASLEYVCNAFQDQVFSPSLADYRSSTTSTFCNVKDSPFAEVLFKFDHQLGREAMVELGVEYDFMGLQCFAQLVYEDGATFRNISTNEVPLWEDVVDSTATSQEKIFLHRLGIDLITQPTRETTMVRFRCVLDYKSTDGKYGMVNCNHVITFHDCDAPLFPKDQETDVFEECRQDCGDKVEPRGYCGGNYLYSTVTNMDRTIFYEVDPQLECCAECGNEDFQCLPLAHTSVYPDADDTLKQCSQPGGYHPPYTNVLMAQTITKPFFAVASIALAVLIISMVARRPKVNADQSAYIPLL